jgi:hypothetical protein
MTIIWALFALAAGAAAADPHNILTSEEKASGWKLLFDGKTFSGWEDPASETPPGENWVVEDGCIKAVPKPRIQEDLFTSESFEDFELVFEWRIAPKGNSGVKYRVQDRIVLEEGKLKPGAKKFEEMVDYELRNRLGVRNKIAPGARVQEYVIAFEYQMIDDSGHKDAAAGGDHITGAIYSMVAPTKRAARPAGEFNQSRIVLRGNHVEHWLNGERVVDVQLDSDQIAEGLAKRWTTGSPVYQMLTKQPKKKTPITLQHHNDAAWFRNIKIRPL